MSRQKEPEHCKSQVVEMFLQKPRKWSSVCENIGVMLKKLSEETLSESRQIKN